MSEPRAQEAPAADSSTPDPIPDKIKQYNRAVRLAKLTSILLEKVDFKISPEALVADRSELKRELNVKTEILSYEAASGDCTASIVWTIAMMRKRKRVTKCTANYIVLYEEIKECTEDVIQMFIDNVGKTATYAYLRALYAHLDWSANLGSPPLPVIQFQPRFAKPKAASM